MSTMVATPTTNWKELMLTVSPGVVAWEGRLPTAVGDQVHTSLTTGAPLSGWDGDLGAPFPVGLGVQTRLLVSATNCSSKRSGNYAVEKILRERERGGGGGGRDWCHRWLRLAKFNGCWRVPSQYLPSCTAFSNHCIFIITGVTQSVHNTKNVQFAFLHRSQRQADLKQRKHWT